MANRDSRFGIRDSLIPVGVALPCIALAAISAWWCGGTLIGSGLWPPDRVSLAEAIATRNNAEALRLITLGASPNQPSHVRDGLLIDGRDVVVTPLEAAVGAQRADSLRMLLANGAVVDEGELRVLRCYERTRPDSGVREILDARLSDEGRGTTSGAPGLFSTPLGPGSDCTGVRLPVDRVE